VADGETLWGIARRYEVTVDAVREANGMENETIRPGQTLRIPRASSSSATASSARTEFGGSRPAASSTGTAGERSASTARPSTSASGSTATRPAAAGASGTRTSAAARRREHTVGDGETLWGIARRYETTVDSLRRANDLEADEQIQPGQKLTIPES
jgi:LysM repeat protein